MFAGFAAYVRSHHVGLLALFVALSGTAYAASLPKNSVGAKQLKKNAVTATKLKKGAVGNQKLKKGAVTGSKLKDGAVAGSKLKDGAITASKVLDGSLVASDFKASDVPRGEKGEAGGAQAVGYATRQPPSPEPQPVGASNEGVLNLDAPPSAPGFISGSGVVSATVPSTLTVNAYAVLKNNSASPQTFTCRLAYFPVGTTAQQPFAVQSDTAAGPNEQIALPIAGGTEIGPGGYNVRVQCFTFPAAAGTFSFVRGSVTATVAPR